MPPAITPERIAQLITEAPGWARVGLTAPKERLRDAAAGALGLWVWERLERPPSAEEDAEQLTLPLTFRLQQN